MFKLIVMFTLLTAAGAAMSSPIEPTMSMKERLRLSLWIDGLDQAPIKLNPSQIPQKQLPEELERPLRKL